MSEEQIAELNNISQELEDLILYRSESGAFNADAKERENIINQIVKSKELAKDEKFIEARKTLLLAYVKLSDILRNKGFSWRVIHLWGIIPISYYLLITIIMLFVSVYYNDCLNKTEILGVPINAVMFSVYGGLLRGLWWVHKKIQSKSFRPHFTLPYLIAPWIAAIIGVFIWLVFTAGIMTLTNSSNENLINKEAIYALCFIGGFSWEWVLSLIDIIKKRTG